MEKLKTWVKYELVEENCGRFVLAPLERGMGTTIGNALRRSLLSSLKGVSVTNVKIEGVTHEFSTVPNVVEDVLDIISNIKGVIFKVEGEQKEEIKVTILQKGKGLISANDIKTDASVKIINPNHHIAQVSEKGNLNMELTIKQGVGYLPAELNKGEESSVDTISIDTTFSPIVRVNHTIKNIRVGKELDHDELTLDVWTNGSLSPDEVVQDASSILIEKIELFNNLNQKPEEDIQEKKLEEIKNMESVLNMSIDDLELSARSSNCLKRAGIDKVVDLVKKNKDELDQIKNFGKKSADEIDEKLQQFDLSLSKE